MGSNEINRLVFFIKPLLYNRPPKFLRWGFQCMDHKDRESMIKDGW